MAVSLPIINLAEATYECTFGRGCEGVCCKNGRPGIFPDEAERIDDRLADILPLLRPEARELIEEAGYLSRRTRDGLPLARVAAGWCVFFHQGCVLHQLGAQEGDKLRYKPVQCALFPLAIDDKDRWFVRQWGKNEPWDLFCLNPRNSTRPAAESLQEEIALAIQYDQDRKMAENVS